MTQTLAKHGSEAGYRAELETNSVCDRCIKGHRVFNKQYTKAGRSKGLKYTRYEVVDHLYSAGAGSGNAGRLPGRNGRRQEPPRTPPAPGPQDAHTDVYAGMDGMGEGQDFTLSAEPVAPSLADRLSDGLKRLVIPGSNEYVNDNDIPPYLHEAEPDPEPPNDEWTGPDNDEFVINKAGMELIEDNLGTYLSAIGITLEVIDPYCGPILADNFENIVGRWTKVIARYPRAAKLFMNKDGGTLMAWIGALQATWPVLLAIYDHHLAKNIQTDKQGRVFKVRNAPENNGHNFTDATTPPFAFTVD